MSHPKIHFVKNLAILAVSIAAAVLLARLGVFETILGATQGTALLGSFVAGLFFTSVLTVAPATVALVALGGALNPVTIAAIGALGSVIGDLVLFYFVRDRISEDVAALFPHRRLKRLSRALHLGAFHFLTPVIGFLIIASPFPDELGIAMMGFEKIRTRAFMLLSYTANFLGILIVASLGRVL